MRLPGSWDLIGAVRPREAERAFTSLAGFDLELILTLHHERVVRNDHTVTFGPLLLPLPPSRDRVSFARCPVVVHEFLDGTLGVSFQGKVLARYDQAGQLQPSARRTDKAA
jgi:hypothetical protein